MNFESFSTMPPHSPSFKPFHTILKEGYNSADPTSLAIDLKEFIDNVVGLIQA